MSLEAIITIVCLGVSTFAGIITLVVALIRGDIKKFVEEKMVEAEKLNLNGEQKLKYVLQAVKEKYKILELLLNVKKLVEHTIELTKKINYKK